MAIPDHRQLGRQLGIFATDPECGSGLPFWLPAGATVRRELERFVTELEQAHGYQHVNTPVMAKRELYERSGVVGGLSRVRQMTLNDGHVFCPAERVGEEISDILAMVTEAYRALDIPAPKLRLSRAGEGDKYVSDPALWREGEQIIRDALHRVGASFTEAEGEAAFYGPKIDLQVTDPQGRAQTLSTIQVDLLLPKRFGLHYTRVNERHRPVMVHRSIISTMERMTAHLLEVHNGALPLWLSPVQVLVLPATDDALDYASRVGEQLAAAGLRAELDAREATLGARIRTAQPRRIPYLLVVGAREATDATVSVRLRGGEQEGPVALDRFVTIVRRLAQGRGSQLRVSAHV